MDKLYILDAAGFIYRSYFAIRNMTNPKGESTNAIFGFIRSVMRLFKDFHPHYCAAIWDGPQNTLAREAIYSSYKAHRQKMPDDLIYQIKWAHQFCDLIGLPQLNIPGVEADDTIGSIANWAASNGLTVFVCTSDKDLCQLVNDHIYVLNTFKENQVLGAAEVQAQFGVRPDQMIDFLAITGDSSDNVPGIAGFGPKTASDLLMQFDNLDNILKKSRCDSRKKTRGFTKRI